VNLAEVRVIAHRGNSALLPGNTMAAFRSAVTLGAHMIELDVRLSRDGVPVVVHDDRVESPTGAVEVRELTAGRLSLLGVPLLEEVLALPVAVDVEIKEPAAIPAVIDQVSQRVDVVVSSFDLDALDFLRQLQPRLPVAYLSRERDWAAILERAAAARAFALNPPRATLTPELVDRAHGAGLRVMSYTVNDPAEARQLLGWGVDAIFTDDPGRMLAIL